MVVASYLAEQSNTFFHTPPFIPTGCQEIYPNQLLASFFLSSRYSVKICIGVTIFHTAPNPNHISDKYKWKLIYTICIGFNGWHGSCIILGRTEQQFFSNLLKV
jgi:hypothetical protein